MGTNYYVRENECNHCGRYEEIHLGKSSGGWMFSFQYNDGKFYKDVKTMKKWLKDKNIFNEYGEHITHDDFWKMVKNKQTEQNCHAIDVQDPHSFLKDGYSFINVWFS